MRNEVGLVNSLIRENTLVNCMPTKSKCELLKFIYYCQKSRKCKNQIGSFFLLLLIILQANTLMWRKNEFACKCIHYATEQMLLISFMLTAAGWKDKTNSKKSFDISLMNNSLCMWYMTVQQLYKVYIH